MFRYNRAGAVCELYHYWYVASCQLIGGTASPPIDECLDIGEVDPNSCDGFLQENCEYSDLILEEDSVTDRHSCQDFLIGLGPLTGAKYFVYDSDNHKCKLYSSIEYNCSTALGPSHPDIEECNNPISTTKNPISTTSTVTTTDVPVNNTCNYPGEVHNGDWFCKDGPEGGLSTCFLTCKPGYVSEKIIISCQPDGRWGPEPATFWCSPAALLVIGGASSEAASTFEILSSSGNCEGSYNMSVARGFGVAETLNNLILLCGGIGGTNLTLIFDDCMQLNQSSMSWTHHSYTAQSKVQASGAKVRNTFYLTGGFDATGIEQMDPSVQPFWQSGPNLPSGVRSVFGQCTVPWGSDSFFMIGGVTKEENMFFSNAVLLYNTTSDRWTSFPSMQKERSNHACTIVDDTLIVAGGTDGADDTIGSTAEILDLNTSSNFKYVGNLKFSRISAQMNVVDGGKVIIVGGTTGDGVVQDTIEEFDVVKESWSLSDKRLSVGRAAHAMVPVPDTLCNTR